MNYVAESVTVTPAACDWGVCHLIALIPFQAVGLASSRSLFYEAECYSTHTCPIDFDDGADL